MTPTVLLGAVVALSAAACGPVPSVDYTVLGMSEQRSAAVSRALEAWGASGRVVPAAPNTVALTARSSLPPDGLGDAEWFAIQYPGPDALTVSIHVADDVSDDLFGRIVLHEIGHAVHTLEVDGTPGEHLSRGNVMAHLVTDQPAAVTPADLAWLWGSRP